MPSFFYVRFSAHNKVVRRNAATAHALKTLYEYDEVVERGGFKNLTEKSNNFWLTYAPNTRAIRNRKQCIEQLLINLFERLVQRDGELRILPVVVRSAEAVVESLKYFWLVSVFQLSRVNSIIGEFNPNLIEKAGFVDYITYEAAQNLI